MSIFSITLLGAAILLALWYSFFNTEIELDISKEMSVDEEEDKYVVARRIELAAKAQYLKALSNPADWDVLNYYGDGSFVDGVHVGTETENYPTSGPITTPMLAIYKAKLREQGWIDSNGQWQNMLEESSAAKIRNIHTGVVLFMGWDDDCIIVGKSLRRYGTEYKMWPKGSAPR